MTTALDYSAITAPVSCSMRADCRRAVSHVDENGFYCATCAAARRAWKSCRKLRPAEIRRLGAVWEMSYLVKVRGEHGCSVMATLESAVGQAEHYRSATAGRVVDIFETRACGHCRGAVAQKACKVCKGVEPADVLIRTLADDAEPVPAARDPRHTYLVWGLRVKAYGRSDVERAYPGAPIRLVIDGSFDGLKNMSLQSPQAL